MARKIITEKDRKNKRKKIFFMIVLFLAVLAIGGFCIWKFVINKSSPSAAVIKVLDNSLEEYGYLLNDKDSKYFKNEYDELKKILQSSEINEEQYVTKIARLFVIDLYTLSTKMNKYDVGGTEFYFANKKAMLEQKAMDTLYSTIADNTYGDRKQELPEINNVETISTEKTTYNLNDEKVDAYLVKLKWTYVKDMGYDKEASIILCKENDKRWSVVDLQPTLNPKYQNKTS